LKKPINISKNILCSGCGFCTIICPVKCIKFSENNEFLPIVEENCIKCSACVTVCPAFNNTSERYFENKLFTQENYIAYSKDRNIRYQCASGGIVTSICIYAINNKLVDGILLVVQNFPELFMNKRVFARTKDEVIECRGTKYCPTSDFTAIEKILLHTDYRFGFVGRPCEIMALNNTITIIPEIRKRLIFTISLFCSSIPMAKATKELVALINIDDYRIKKINYRGNGWPGKFEIITKNKCYSINYLKAWKILSKSKYIPERCFLCADGLGQYADISTGDAWQMSKDDSNPGISSLIVRSKFGMEIINAMVIKNIIEIEKCSDFDIESSQKSIIQKKIKMKGRYIGTILGGLRVPSSFGVKQLDKRWNNLKHINKIKIIIGSFLLTLVFKIRLLFNLEK